MATRTESVEGLTEFLRAINKADKATKKLVRARLREAGDIVKVEAAARFASVDMRSASRYGVSVRTSGVSVEQRLRRTTGLRPDFGALQMRKALSPALADKEDEVVDEIDKALEDIEQILAKG